MDDQQGAVSVVTLPAFVVADARGGLVVGDYYDSGIKRFDLGGAFLGQIAHRGTAPGEVERPTAASSCGSELWVFDSATSRLTVFDTVSAKMIDSIVHPIRFVRSVASNGSYVVVAASSGSSSALLDSLFHVYDCETRAVVESFGDTNRIWGARLPPEGIGLSPGLICLTVANELVYAPADFWGELFSFTFGDGSPDATKSAMHDWRREPKVVRVPLRGPAELRGLTCPSDGGAYLFLSSDENGNRRLFRYHVRPTGNVDDVIWIDGVRFPDLEYWDYRLVVATVTADGSVVIVDSDSLGSPRIRIGAITE